MNDMSQLRLLRSEWVRILDELELQNRTAWLALFDARLKRVDETTLTLDFSDRDKFAGAHDFNVASRQDFLDALADAISTCLGLNLRVVVETVFREGDQLP